MLGFDIYKAISEGLVSANKTDDVRQCLESITQALDMRCYVYWSINIPGRESLDPHILTNYPETWFHEYGENKFAIIDPVVRDAPLSIGPFAWGTKSYLDNLTSQEIAVFTAAKKHGIRRGIAVPIHAAGNEFSGVSIVSNKDETEAEFDDRYEARAYSLTAIAPLVHSAIRRILNVPDQQSRARLLTPRECECLSWVAKGKSFADVSDILGISRTTVITHVNRSKQKLQVRTTQQAVAQLIGSGLVFSEYASSSI